MAVVKVGPVRMRVYELFVAVPVGMADTMAKAAPVPLNRSARRHIGTSAALRTQSRFRRAKNPASGDGEKTDSLFEEVEALRRRKRDTGA